LNASGSGNPVSMQTYVYKQAGGQSLELDVYYPSGGASISPSAGILFFHGGSWVSGTRDQFTEACIYFAGRGLVAATASYRMHPRKGIEAFPSDESYKRICITDAKSSIRWMKQHMTERGMDSDRLIIGGGSAGGHIALLASTNPGLNDPADSETVDTRVAAYVLFNPALAPGDRADPEVDALTHLTSEAAPAVIFYGSKDRWKDRAKSVLERMQELHGDQTELWIAEDQGHGFFNEEPWRSSTFAAADRFLVSLGLLKASDEAATMPPDAPLVRAGGVSGADRLPASQHRTPLYKDDFSGDLANWQVEQMPGGRVFLEDGRMIIEDEAGCTVWFKEKLKAPVRIVYEVTVSGQARVSDLNCFWMADDPSLPGGLFDPAHQRTGRFSTYDTLRTYYVGYGGNNNSTTRFRRYPGDGSRPMESEHDVRASEFMLRPDHPYRIELIAANGRVQYIRDGEVIFDMKDPGFLTEGYVGFRTVNSRLEIRSFRVYAAVFE
jgi:acetyl esterase/lipase